ncbi:uncharacterized protein N7496_006843 [Penicillium cataractarum]|uniref:Uncharacterized protein n=1 Tax=Penicillium cataractarum TaxID=2100454 RepID=A0A9W9V905_9EURO|nr:uncharacterized protein N7496_006843 [Penicillium cataractarum]KAJ5370751.1 hypothetical protein N7496_006843 [Penicillium cataractarum]
MSNLFRRASDAFHHHQRKDSEDSGTQDNLISPSQEPQEPQEPQVPQVSQVTQDPQEPKAESASRGESQGSDKDKAGNGTPHHHHWGFFRRLSEDERAKR